MYIKINYNDDNKNGKNMNTIDKEDKNINNTVNYTHLHQLNINVELLY